MGRGVGLPAGTGSRSARGSSRRTTLTSPMMARAAAACSTNGRAAPGAATALLSASMRRPAHESPARSDRWLRDWRARPPAWRHGRTRRACERWPCASFRRPSHSASSARFAAPCPLSRASPPPRGTSPRAGRAECGAHPAARRRPLVGRSVMARSAIFIASSYLPRLKSTPARLVAGVGSLGASSCAAVYCAAASSSWPFPL